MFKIIHQLVQFSSSLAFLLRQQLLRSRNDVGRPDRGAGPVHPVLQVRKRDGGRRIQGAGRSVRHTDHPGDDGLAGWDLRGGGGDGETKHTPAGTTPTRGGESTGGAGRAGNAVTRADATDDDAIVLLVAHHLHFEFLPTQHRLLDQALAGTISFDDMLAGIESETNSSIKDGIDRIMG